VEAEGDGYAGGVGQKPGVPDGTPGLGDVGGGEKMTSRELLAVIFRVFGIVLQIGAGALLFIDGVFDLIAHRFKP